MTISQIKAQNGQAKKRKRYPAKKYAKVCHVYFDVKDMDVYEALVRKFPSVRKGAPNLTAFVRAHKEEILGE